MQLGRTIARTILPLALASFIAAGCDGGSLGVGGIPDDAVCAVDGTAITSKEFNRMFGNAETFMAMVRGGYQPVYRPREFAFRTLVVIDGNLIQPVAIVGPDGRRVTALYHMERQPDGTWRIAGCHLVEPEDENA